MVKKISNYYNKIATEYTKLHGYNEHLSLPSLTKFITYLPQKAKVLDIGCGGGQDSIFLKESGFNVLGIDLSKEMIKIAKKHNPYVSFKVLDLMKLKSIIKYDGIWCSRVFHNISIFEQDEFLKKIKTLLKKDGIFYITSVVYTHDLEEIKDGINIKKLTPKSFKELISKHGFKVLKFKYWVGKKGMEIICQKL